MDEKQSPVRVDRVSLRGSGVLILTGPSSCGKGEVAAALCSLMTIDRSRHLSMGDILRTTFERAREDESYRELLATKYALSAEVNLYDCSDTDDELTAKIHRNRDELAQHLGRDVDKFVSQLDWLEFCTVRGLLVPNRWTQDLIAAEIEYVLSHSDAPFILDGYPRTVAAAEHLLRFLASLDVPVIKVLHLSISKAEMLHRAGRRGRADDDESALKSRFDFYVESVQPSVDYMKQALGSEAIALIDAHQPAYDGAAAGGEAGAGAGRDASQFNLRKSIANVVEASLLSLGVPRVIVGDLLEAWRTGETELLLPRPAD